MIDTTIIQVIDKVHIKELSESWKTWKLYKPEVTSLPLFLVYDKEIESELGTISHIIDKKNVTLYPFNNKYLYKSQRDAMLTSFFEGIRNIKTKYYLKLDTDCVATNASKEWLNEINDINENVFISKGWSVSRKEYFDIMQDWEPLKDYPKIQNFSIKECGTKVKYNRIISWFFLCNVEWNNKWSEKCWKHDHYELPIPSHDSFLWHIAERNGDKYKRVNFKKYGWSH